MPVQFCMECESQLKKKKRKEKILIKLEKFMKDSKCKPQLIIIGKTSGQSETYWEPSKTSKMELSAK